MRPNCENHKFITTLALSFLLISTVSQHPATATAQLDSEVIESEPSTTAPPVIPSSSPEVGLDAREDSAPPPAGPGTASRSSAALPIPGQQTYSIRLPLGVAGSVLPRLESGKPSPPASASVMPRPNPSEAPDFNRPVAWRATAEAIRTQPASSSLQIATIASDFKTAYSTIFREAPATGWSLASLSLPAGHFLIKIPKANDRDESDDAATWLVVLLSPIDSRSTEIRIKIQSRRTSMYSAMVSNFIKRCQMQAAGNELL